MLEVGFEGAVARVRLNRPERLNAFDEDLIAALADAFGKLAHLETIRVVVLSGEGKSFCAGADASWMARAGALSEAENRADAQRLSDMLAAIDTCPKPVIAIAHGNVFGGGVGLVACADLVVAAPDVRFRLSEVRLGLTPATISPFVVAKIGASAARRYFLTAEDLHAEEAHRLGLVHAVARHPETQAALWTEQLLQGAPGAIADAKALIRAVVGQPVTDALRADTAARIAARRASDEGKEGLAAFLGKRKPVWATDA